MGVSEMTRFTQLDLHLSENQQAELRDLTHRCIARARRHFSDFTIDNVRVDFDLRGATAGQYHPQQRLIKYNASIAARNYEDFKERTVPHEVSHHIAMAWANFAGIRIKPHGREWRKVMHFFGVTDTRRCHNYDISGVKVKRQRRVIYRCTCLDHEVSMTIHNRIRKGAVYKCRSCHSALTRAH